MNRTGITTMDGYGGTESSVPAFVWAVGLGIAVGIAYVLSPLTIIVGLAMIPLWRWATRGLADPERRWVSWVVVAAVVLRVAAVAWLMVTAEGKAGSFATFFGDEEFFQVKGLRLYNIWMGLPVSIESFIYAYDATGYSSYQIVLVLAHILVGPAPYGVHLMNAGLFLAAAVLLYRLVRSSYGPAPSLIGLAIVLFLPSLFMWSVSALKESLYFACTAVTLVAAVRIARERTWWRAGVALAVVFAGGAAIESLRPAGRALTLGGIAIGFLVRAVLLRRWLIVAATALVISAAAWATHAGLPPRVQTQLVQWASYHRGHVFTPGHSYKLLDPRFYADPWGPIYQAPMTPGETARFVILAPLHYVFEPVPWQIQSRAELAYMPEQLVWYALVVLFPLGFVAGLRRDALLTCLFGCYTLASAAVIAFNSGNIGTLVRHRALAVPYLAWISALGLVRLLQNERADVKGCQ